MQALRWTALASLVTGLVVAFAGVVGADAPAPLPSNPSEVVDAVKGAGEVLTEDPVWAAQNPQAVVGELLGPESSEEGAPGGPIENRDPSFADRIRDAFQGQVLVAGVATVIASMLGLGGFAFVTRYVSPKEALKNPQRAMLYGFVRGNPGVHLKKLSEEFAMKTSSILWHVRKLENAELVRSERANGYRVFYPVDGGIEIKRVSRAITALQNRNARTLYEAVERHAGETPTRLGEVLHMHAGTVRWHLRKLREFGLVEELLRDDGSTLYATPLGRRTLQTLLGTPVVERPIHSPHLTPIPAE